MSRNTDIMKEKAENRSSSYTCNDYRLEMRLLGIRRQLAKPDLSPEERQLLEAEGEKLAKEMGMS